MGESRTIAPETTVLTVATARRESTSRTERRRRAERRENGAPVLTVLTVATVGGEKVLKNSRNFAILFFNFRWKTVIMKLDFPRFGVGGKSASLSRVSARRVGKPRGKLNRIFYVSSRLDVWASSRDFNVGVGFRVGVGVLKVARKSGERRDAKYGVR